MTTPEENSIDEWMQMFDVDLSTSQELHLVALIKSLIKRWYKIGYHDGAKPNDD